MISRIKALILALAAISQQSSAFAAPPAAALPPIAPAPYFQTVASGNQNRGLPPDWIYVRLWDNAPNARIYFTVDGSNPTMQSQWVPSGGFVSIDNVTPYGELRQIRAFAVVPGERNSYLSSELYDLGPNLPGFGW